MRRGPLRRGFSPGDSAALNRLDPRRRRVHLRRVALARREVRSLERGVARGGVLRREDTQDGGARRARGSFDRRRPLDARGRFARQRLPRLRLPEPKLGDELASPFPARERLVLLGSPPEQGLESHHRAVRLRGVLRLHRRRHRRRLRSLGAPLRGDGFGRGRDGGAAGRDRAGRRGLRRDRAGRVIPRVIPRRRRRRRLSFLPLHLLVHRVQHSLRSLLLHSAPRGLLPDPHLGRSRLEHARHRRLRVPLVRLGRDGLVKRLRVVQGAVRDAVEEVPGGVNLRVGDQAAHRVGDVLFGGVIGVLVHDGALVLVAVLERRGAILPQLSQRLEPLRLNRRKLFVLLRQHPVAHATQPSLRDPLRLLLPGVDRPAKDVEPLLLQPRNLHLAFRPLRLLPLLHQPLSQRQRRRVRQRRERSLERAFRPHLLDVLSLRRPRGQARREREVPDREELRRASFRGVPLRQRRLLRRSLARVRHVILGFVRDRLRLGFAIRRLRPDRLTPRRVERLDPFAFRGGDGVGGGQASAVKGVGGGDVGGDAASRRVGRRRSQPRVRRGRRVHRPPEVPVRVSRNVHGGVASRGGRRGDRRGGSHREFA